MKTVMKKMFSLLLVAALLVGVMPFAAFADTDTETDDQTNNTVTITLVVGNSDYTLSADDKSATDWHPSIRKIIENWFKEDSSRFSHAAKLNSDGSYTKVTDIETEVHVGETWRIRLNEEEVDPCANGHSWNAGSITTQPTCTTAGVRTYTCDRNSEHTYTESVDADPNAHSWGGWTVTTAATCTTEGVKTRTCTLNSGHTDTGTIDKDPTNHGNGCTCAVTITLSDDKNGSSTVTSKPGATINLSDPEFVAGYKFLGWKLNGTGDYLDSFQIPGTAVNGTTYTIRALWEKNYSTPTYTLNVYARLKIGDIVQDVDLIHTKTGLMENDAILDYLKNSNTRTTLKNKIAKDYPDYDWSGNFHNAYGDTAATDNITTVDGSKSVYINLYAEQDDVRLYVYTDADCEDYELLYELDGYKANSVNDTVTSADVLSFLKGKLGSGISIKMFDEAGFDGYWRGKENTSTNYVAVKDGTTRVHVRVYNAYSSSSSSKADSSNPKTGDAIFAPMMVLGASASALAVLFYLNKKRAY